MAIQFVPQTLECNSRGENCQDVTDQNLEIPEKTPSRGDIEEKFNNGLEAHLAADDAYVCMDKTKKGGSTVLCFWSHRIPLSSIPTVSGISRAEGIAAVVENKIILFADLEDRLKYFEGKLPPSGPQRIAAKKQLIGKIIELMVDEVLMDIEVEKFQITISEADVQKAIDEQKSKNGLDDEGLEQALKAEGTTMDKFRAETKRRMLHLKLQNIAVRSRINPPKEDEVRQVYKRALAEARASIRPYKEVRDQIKQSLYEKTSAQPTEADIQKAYKDMTDAMVSSSIPPYKEARDKITESLYHDVLQKRIGSWLKGLRSKSYIDVRLNYSSSEAP